MDLKKIAFVLLFSFSLSLQQSDYIVELELSFREEQIPSIINYLLTYEIEKRNITTQDVIQLSKLIDYQLDQMEKVLDFYNYIPGDVFTVKNLENLLKNVNVSVSTFIQDFTNRAQFTTEQTSSVFKDLEIPDEIWIHIALKNDEKIYESLKQGKYDEEHLEKALATAGKTKNDFYTTFRDVTQNYISQLDSKELVSILRENEISLTSLFEAVNITIEDIYKVDKFRDIFSSIIDSLNQNSTIGVFVNSTQIAIHQKIYENLEKNVDGVAIKVEADRLEVDVRNHERLGENIVGLATKNSRLNYIEIVKNYTFFDECVYVCIVDKKIIREKVEVTNSSVETSDKVQFILGSPLICDDLLYGLAREEVNGTIIFDTFYTEANPPPPPPIYTNAAVTTTFSLAFILIIPLLCVN